MTRVGLLVDGAIAVPHVRDHLLRNPRHFRGRAGGPNKPNATPCRTRTARCTPACGFYSGHRHLSTEWGASDESWSGRIRQLVCLPDGRGVLDPVVGLTCLSFRCLSSYLFFPPVPVTSKLRARLASEVRRSEGSPAPLLISQPIERRTRRKKTDLIHRRNA